MTTVVCTDRGQHPRRRLAFTGSSWDDPKPIVVQNRNERTGGVRFTCHTCGRDIQLTKENWDRLTAELATAGLTQVDVSYLPL
jgi:hypothetical protein